MDHWIVFDKAVVTARISAAEQKPVNALGAGTGDPLQEIIDDVVAEVRTAVATCARNRLDPDVRKIPASLVNDACSLVSYYFATRAPGARILAEDARYQAWAKANEKLNRVRSCEIAVEDYATGSVAGGISSAAQTICATKRRLSRRVFDNI